MQDGTDSGQNFLHRERFGNVIIRTQRESEKQVILFILCREEDNGHSRRPFLFP